MQKIAAKKEESDEDDVELGDMAKMPSDEALREAVMAIMDAESDVSKVTFKVRLLNSQGCFFALPILHHRRNPTKMFGYLSSGERTTHRSGKKINLCQGDCPGNGTGVTPNPN